MYFPYDYSTPRITQELGKTIFQRGAEGSSTLSLHSVGRLIWRRVVPGCSTLRTHKVDEHRGSDR